MVLSPFIIKEWVPVAKAGHNAGERDRGFDIPEQPLRFNEGQDVRDELGSGMKTVVVEGSEAVIVSHRCFLFIPRIVMSAPARISSMRRFSHALIFSSVVTVPASDGE